jgi:hypothetical protein
VVQALTLFASLLGVVRSVLTIAEKVRSWRRRQSIVERLLVDITGLLGDIRMQLQARQ